MLLTTCGASESCIYNEPRAKMSQHLFFKTFSLSRIKFMFLTPKIILKILISFPKPINVSPNSFSFTHHKYKWKRNIFLTYFKKKRGPPKSSSGSNLIGYLRNNRVRQEPAPKSLDQSRDLAPAPIMAALISDGCCTRNTPLPTSSACLQPHIDHTPARSLLRHSQSSRPSIWDYSQDFTLFKSAEIWSWIQ